MGEKNPSRDKNPKAAEHYCLTLLKEANTSMEWSITNFDIMKIDSLHTLESSSFESVTEGVHTGTWKMKLVPKFGKNDYLGLFFSVSGSLPFTFAEIQACLIDEVGKETNMMHLSTELVGSSEPGFETFIEKSKLEGFLKPNQFLSIRCDITVIRMNSNVCKAKELDDGNTLEEDFASLLKDATFSDAVLVSGGRKFPIHKCILSARSTVFSDMFKKEGQEKVKSFEINDTEADVLENVLSYIYTDKVQGNCTTQMALKLLIAADKFGLEDLLDIASEYLESQVSEQNLLELASSAELHKLTSLQEACIDFMCDHGKEIVFSGNSRDFFKNAPQFLVKGVFEKLFEDPPASKEQCASKRNSERVTSCPSCDVCTCEVAPTPPCQLPSQPAPFAFGSNFTFGANAAK